MGGLSWRPGFDPPIPVPAPDLPPALNCGAKHIPNYEGSNTYQQKHHEILEHSSLQVSAEWWLEHGTRALVRCRA
jgi:hypothetical protein